jgi:hypothetical protein
MAPRGWLMRRVRGLAAAVVLAVLISACGSSSPGAVTDEASVDDTAGSGTLPFQIQNQGGSMEGHTPRGFAGSGTGLFDLPPTGAAATCNRVGDGGIECDVTAAVARAVDAGEDRAQFRLKFDTAGDNDGAADLAMFFLTDSNTNERGIFTLNLS